MRAARGSSLVAGTICKSPRLSSFKCLEVAYPDMWNQGSALVRFPRLSGLENQINVLPNLIVADVESKFMSAFI